MTLQHDLFFCLLFIIYFSFQSAELNTCRLKENCPPHLQDIVKAYERIQNETSVRTGSFYGEIDFDIPCIFEGLAQECAIESRVETSEVQAVPSSHGWSVCENCVYHIPSNEVHLHFRRGSKPETSDFVDLSWSLWGEYFHVYGNDKFRGRINYFEEDQPGHVLEGVGLVYVNRPVFILPLITLHVGHVLVDLLEEIYFAMMNVYKEIRRDALIFIDVASTAEREILFEKLMQNIYGGHDNVGRVLQIFSALPILPLQVLLRSGYERVVFRHLHIGTDLQNSSFHRGHVFHPCIFDPRMVSDYAAEFSAFKNYLWGVIQYSPSESRGPVRLTFVQRRSSRSILNLEELVNTASSRAVESITIDLSTVPFTEQLRIFSQTDVLVAVGGTALHNVLFLPRGSSVLVLMPPGWCDWAWMYANQAVLLGIHAEVLCAPAAGPQTFHWTRSTWLQGPGITKSANLTVNRDVFGRHLDNALAFLAGHGVQRLSSDLLPHCQQPPLGTESKPRPPAPSPTSSAPLRMFLSSVRTRERRGAVCVLEIMGEIFSPAADVPSLLASMPHLAVCLAVTGPPSCHPIETFNYHSHLLVSLTAGAKEVSAHGGKLSGSDTYVSLDLSLGEDGGFLSVHGGTSLRVEVVLPEEEVKTFQFVHSGLHSFQLAVADFCAENALRTDGCLLLVAHLSERLHKLTMIETLGLPKIQTMPTKERPFVFLHVEKTAGTTLREFIVASAERHGLAYLVPCHGGVHCVTLTLHDAHAQAVDTSAVAVLAGHFSWGVWKELPSARTDGPPPCLIMARDPVDRAISYYYQRCFQIPDCPGYGRRINSLSAEELRWIALHDRQAQAKSDGRTVVVLDEGMSDASCRAILGLKVTAGREVDEFTDIQIPDPLGAHSAELALYNARQCIVGMIDRMEETKRIMGAWFLWLDTSAEKAKKMQLYSNKEDRSGLRPELQRVLVEVNPCDVALYEGMKAVFENQLHVVNSRGFVK